MERDRVQSFRQLLRIWRWLLLATALPLLPQQTTDWPNAIRALVDAGELEQAQARVEEWTRSFPRDLDATAWHARILSWRGRLAESEAEFRALLEQAPSDTDLLMGLAHVLNLRRANQEALGLLTRACDQPPERADCRLEQARTLALLGRTVEAKALYRRLSSKPSVFRESEAALEELSERARHELRIGGEADVANYIQNGSVVSASFASRWSSRWRTAATVTEYRRFGQRATGLEGSATYRLPGAGAITLGAGSAGSSGIAPKADMLFGYDQGFRISAGPVRGLEALYDQKWIWYPGDRILNFSPGVLVQLPKRCDWLLRLSATRIDSQAGLEWTPSLQTRFTVPVRRRVRAYLLYATGAENFATVDQIRFRSSRVAGGGLIVRTLFGQEFRTHFQRETIAGGLSQNGFGGAYAFRF